MQVLEKHSNGMPRARVFAHALWGLAKSASEWDELQPWIEDGLSPQLYSEMAPLFVRETPVPSPDKATSKAVVSDAVPSQNTQPKDVEQQPKPLVFSLMRNGHEVIRGLARDCEDALAADQVETFKATYQKLRKWEDIHADMEDGIDGVAKGFFQILNEKFDGLADKEGLTSAHTVSVPKASCGR
jgi:hypothetical protein